MDGAVTLVPHYCIFSAADKPCPVPGPSHPPLVARVRIEHPLVQATINDAAGLHGSRTSGYIDLQISDDMLGVQPFQRVSTVIYITLSREAVGISAFRWRP